MRFIYCIFACTFCLCARAEDPISAEQIDARLRQAMAIAKDSNRQSLVNDLLRVRDTLTRAIERKDSALIDRQLREVEKFAGLDAGGLSMAGLPVARTTFRENKQLDEIRGRLNDAMKTGELPRIQKEIAAMKKLLGDRAGVPDVRRKGENPEVMPIKPAELTTLFGKILDAEKGRLKPFVDGKPKQGILARDVASIAQGCVAMRQLILKHEPARKDSLDQLIAGCCVMMIAMQTEQGFFRFPDLRGKHIRFGEICEQLVQDSVANISEGWVVVPLPNGGSFVDAGECGIALLRAGAEYKNPTWTRAGMKAVEWVLTQSPTANFHENSFVVSLLVEAYRQTAEAKYRQAALVWWHTAVSPCQVENGRWLDGENARTSNHFMILRSMNDLRDILLPGDDRVKIEVQANKALKAILDEADSLGTPNSAFTVRGFSHAANWADKSEVRLNQRLLQAATIAHQKCIQKGIKAATPFPELAALADIWK